jgi:Secretin and TonB N terminus short domain
MRLRALRMPGMARGFEPRSRVALGPRVVRLFALGNGLRLMLVLSALLVTAAFAETPLAVSVPAGDLSEALELLARQYGVDVIYPSEQLKGKKTQGVVGTFEPTQAFTKLLDGTSLTLSEEGGALLIVPRTNHARPPPGRRISEPLPQVEIQAQRAKLSEMRKELDRLEDQFFREYNQLNTDHQWDVHCRTEIRTGSHVGIRICTPAFVSEAMHLGQRPAFQGRPDQQMSVSPAAPVAYTLILQKTAAYQKNMIEIVRAHPELFELVKQRAELAEQYQVALKMKFTGKSPAWDASRYPSADAQASR